MLYLQMSAQSHAAECVLILDDKHNYEIIDGAGGALLGAFLGGGVLASVVANSASSTNQANSSTKEIALRDFLVTNKPQPDETGLKKIGALINIQPSSSGCQVNVTIKATKIVGNRYGGDLIEQFYNISKFIDGSVIESDDVNVGTVFGILVFQPKSQKRLKEDPRTGKYIDVTSPMIASDIYNKKIADLYSKVTIKNLASALKKTKVALQYNRL